MQTQCPKCKASGKIDDSKIPEKGAYVRCPKCDERFYLEKEFRLELEQPQEIKFGDSNANSSKKEKMERKEVEPRDNKNYSTDKYENKHPAQIKENLSDKQNAGKLRVIVGSIVCVFLVATLLYVSFGLVKEQDSNEVRKQNKDQNSGDSREQQTHRSLVREGVFVFKVPRHFSRIPTADLERIKTAILTGGTRVSNHVQVGRSATI